MCCVRVQDVVESWVIFPEHLSLSQLQEGVRSGRCVQGTFLASRENYLEGTLRVRGDGDSDKEVLIQGLQHLNRAMHDDIVCVEMFPEERWVAPSSLVLHDEGVAGDVAEENEEDVLKAESGKMRRPTGKVVGIIKRNSRPLCGMLMPSPIKEATRHLFTPADRRMPRVRVETRQAASLQAHRIVVAIGDWLRHSRYPNGHFVRSLGECGDKETETEVLLLEHDVPHQPFSQAVLACLPPPTFSITAEDQAGREDLRALSICSVDPPGCTDIDDALHCKPLDNGNTEAGVLVHMGDDSKG
ncbi:exosome complex exonuclease RRP44-like [Petromyzon marinus]|uniref:exosome complex exonuclease RRP44-like n=1 Tax=Petromyzon marinus TaxID=7757 RepID=UPI003F705B03